MDCFRSNFEQVAPFVLFFCKGKERKRLDCSSDIDDDQEMEPTPGNHTLFVFYCVWIALEDIYAESLVHANVSSNNT